MPVISKGYIITDKCCDKTRFYDSIDDFPETGLVSRLYVDRETGIIYVWDGTEYINNDIGETYYNNSYNERLKAFGVNVQYTTNFGAGSVNSALVDGTLVLSSIFINKTSTITGVSWYQGIQGNYTADNYNGICLYSYDKVNGKLVLIASSTDDGDIWKSAGAAYVSKNFTTPVTITSGVYYIGALYNSSAQTTAPSLVAQSSLTQLSSVFNLVPTTDAKFVGSVASQNTLPAEILNTTVANSINGLVFNLY